MAPTRVGTLETLNLTVYANKDGTLFFNEDGSRVRLHGNMKWVSDSNVLMRGSRPLQAPPHANADATVDELEAQELALAIAASLQEATQPVEADNEDAPAGEDAAPDAAPAGAPSSCAICLSAPVSHLCRPCNHLIACGGCARRLARHPCPVCRRNVTACERVFFG